MFDNKNVGELTKLFCESDVNSKAEVIEIFVKVYTDEFGIGLLYCVSLPGCTHQCALNYTDIKIQTLQDKFLIFTLENKIRGGLSGVMGERCVKSDENEEII